MAAEQQLWRVFVGGDTRREKVSEDYFGEGALVFFIFKSETPVQETHARASATVWRDYARLFSTG